MTRSITLIIIIFSVSCIYSQQSKYFDAPFGGGGGFTPGWIFPDFDELNSKLNQFGVSEFSNSGFFTSGGAGFIYIGFVKNLRIGGMGFGGSKSVTGNPDVTIPIFKASNSTSLQEIVNREVVYSLGGGGLTVEYTLPFIKNFGVSLGAIIGGGTLKLDIYSNRGSFNWDDVWTNVSQPASSANDHRTIESTFWFFSPTLNVDIPVYRFIVFRVGGGYQLTVAESWSIDNEQDLSGVPSDLNGNCFFIQTGIFIGFFSF